LRSCSPGMEPPRRPPRRHTARLPAWDDYEQFAAVGIRGVRTACSGADRALAAEHRESRQSWIGSRPVARRHERRLGADRPKSHRGCDGDVQLRGRLTVISDYKRFHNRHGSCPRPAHGCSGRKTWSRLTALRARGRPASATREVMKPLLVWLVAMEAAHVGWPRTGAASETVCNLMERRLRENFYDLEVQRVEHRQEASIATSVIMSRMQRSTWRSTGTRRAARSPKRGEGACPER